MGLLPFLVMASAVHNSRTRSHSRYVRTSSKSTRKTRGIHYSSSRYSYISYLLKELQHGESIELSDFVTKLFSYGNEIVEEHNNEVLAAYRQQLEAIHSEYLDYLIHFKETEEKLHQLNIDLSGKGRDYIFDRNFEDLEVYGIFNGIMIKDFYTRSDNCEENVRKSDDLFEQKRKELKKQANRVVSLKAKKQELLAEVVELEKKIKIPFGRKEKIKRLEEVQEKIHRIDKSIEDITVEFEKVLQYERLTFEQKLAIMEYIHARRELSKIHSRYDHLYYNSPCTYSSVHLTITSEVDADLWFKALSRMFEREDIDLEYIDKVFDQIEQAPAKWIPQELEMRSSCGAVEEYRQLLSFLLNYVYFPEYCDVLTRRVRYTDIQEELEEPGKVKVKK